MKKKEYGWEGKSGDGASLEACCGRTRHLRVESHVIRPGQERKLIRSGSYVSAARALALVADLNVSVAQSTLWPNTTYGKGAYR